MLWLWVGVCLAVLHGANAQMLLLSPAFRNGESIPEVFCCDVVERDGYRPSVPLQWARAPAKVQSFVLMVDDMASGVVHWLVKDIPRDTVSLEADASETNMPAGSVELPNSFGYESYEGPCPRNETRQYRFRLFAMERLHTTIDVGLNRSALRSEDIVTQLKSQTLYVSVLIGKFYLPEPPKVAEQGTLVQSDVLSFNISTFRPKNKTRVVVPDYKAFRYIKPSEVLKPQRPHNDLSVPDACVGARAVKSAECIAAIQTDQANAWSCKAFNRIHGGMRFAGDTGTERCGMKVRIPDMTCDKFVLPRQYACNSDTGLSMSPSVMWQGAPENTKSFVLILEDVSTTAVSNHQPSHRVHWLVGNIPAEVNSIDVDATGKAMPPLSMELKNSFGTGAYQPPCPADNDDYVFRLWLFAMPHESTHLLFAPTAQVPLSALVQRLQHEALCASSTDIPFSYRSSVVSMLPELQLHNMVRPVDAAQPNTVPGEISI